MSKLQRLDDRVAKLLTEAVHEVLEMVKETVLEYREKTARTQRENENLKRKLQELNDKITKDSTSALVPSESLPLDREDPVDQEQDLSCIQRQTSEFTDVDQREIQGYRPVHDVKQESKEENYINTVADTEEDTEHDEAKSEGVTYTSEETVTINISHFPNTDNNPVFSDNVHASQSTASLGENHPVVKKESDPTDCATTEPPSLQNQYSGCLELSCNSSHNSMEVLRPQIITESHQHVFVHSGHNISKRHVFSKTSGTAFQIRRFRREHFQTKDSHLCVTCGKSFSRVWNLEIHRRSHTGERPYGCVQCGRHFSQAGDLKKHERVHTGEKPFYCNQCGKSFSRRENLNRHQKIHVGERPQLQQVWMGQQ